MPRELTLNLHSLLKERAPDTTQAQLAAMLGVSEGTIRRYINNQWTVLDRKATERLADFLECDVPSLLTTGESKFFEPFDAKSNGLKCLYLRREDAEDVVTGRPVAYRDNRAMDRLGRWFRDSGIEVDARQDAALTCDKFHERLSHNCIVIGSPRVNPASGMAIGHAFGLKRCDSPENGKIPFAFRVSADAQTSPSSSIETAENDRTGIWLRKSRRLLRVESWSRADFYQRRIAHGRDYAVILVWNHQTASTATRKLVVLAGFSGVGTEAAANALANDYRDLEPVRKSSGPVWGVIEVLYKKRGNSMAREFLSYSWRYRVGGRCPIELSKKQE